MGDKYLIALRFMAIYTKKRIKICIYAIFVVSLHRQLGYFKNTSIP
jgi:hypothetical protein